VIFRPGTVLKADGSPYTIFTPFKKRWLQHFESHEIKQEQALLFDKFRHEIQTAFPSLEQLGFKASCIQVPDFAPENIVDYEETRDYPGLDKTTKIGPHLRFGTISIRKLIRERGKESEIYTSELIWREFFIQILYLFPKVVKDSFKSKYDRITWLNNSQDFDRWCKGETGIPLVDAGMRELNQTGFMHNRVRMICASFLCKNLLIDWRLGEAYFASKLLDFELASNNGNWQWSAGTGCDSAPYFRVFNPETQQKRFDADQKYIRRWISDLDELTYPKPMVDLKASRVRAIDTYKSSINS
jgi:deoxyribodipyrimidine photo-lyase